MEAGKTVLANPDATQEEADAAMNAILDELFQLAKKADVTSLESLTLAAKELSEGNFTSDSLLNLREAIHQAEVVLADQNREQDDIANAYQNLADAIRKLERKGNKAALEAMLAKAGEVLEHAEIYVPSTIQGLAEAVAKARAVYEDEDATQSEVSASVRELTRKLADARLLGDVDGDGNISTGDTAAVLKASAEMISLSGTEKASADVNGDGSADTKDAVLILQYASEKTDAFR